MPQDKQVLWMSNHFMLTWTSSHATLSYVDSHFSANNCVICYDNEKVSWHSGSRHITVAKYHDCQVCTCCEQVLQCRCGRSKITVCASGVCTVFSLWPMRTACVVWWLCVWPVCVYVTAEWRGVQSHGRRWTQIWSSCCWLEHWTHRYSLHYLQSVVIFVYGWNRFLLFYIRQSLSSLTLLSGLWLI